MTRFSAGEQVIIRYGRHQGKRATVIRSQPGDAYRVKVEDGTVLFFSSKGLERKRNENASVLGISSENRFGYET
jgi:hypothetical protein